MKQNLILLVAALFMPVFVSPLFAQADGKMNIIIIGAHPDDADKVGGTAYKWKLAGFDVLMVSFTNGDAGHQTIKAEELAKIRREEARRAGEVIGIRYITLDNPDGKLMPTYENRLQMIKLIREHKADVVIFPRPYDYHPDHRYTGTLVLDAAYMVTVPTILPEVPHLERNPMFLYMSDGFTIPVAFVADVAIEIDDVIEKKMDMYHEHKSQMYEWMPFNGGYLESIPVSDADRRAWLGASRKRGSDATPHRNKLIELYGPERGAAIRYCETFQDSGYGRRLTKDNLKTYFPFLP
ncbi:MAG: PIG-L family deacetylase [Bacteroidales bacterium]|nr:PIG-L family deacetylase [Bacteroidales bacterium]